MDEEIKAAEEAVNALNAQNTGEENSQEESPTTEQTTEDTSTEASEQVETGGEDKKGFQSRVKELNTRAKLAEEKALSLETKLAELTNPTAGVQVQDVPQFNPQEPIIADGEEITVTELNKRIAERDQRLLSQASANSELRFKQEQAIIRINSEASAAIRKHPELDPESESYNPKLSKAVTKATEAYVSKNPYSASVKDFVDELMIPYKEGVTKEVGQVTENIAKQVSETALRPTSIRKGEKTAEEMPLAELERKLGVVQS